MLFPKFLFIYLFRLPVCLSGVSFSFLVPGEHNMNYLCTVAFWRRKFCASDSINVVSATELVMLATFIFCDARRPPKRSRRCASPGLWFARHFGLSDHVEQEMRIFQATSKTPEALLWTIVGALVLEGARPAYQIHVYSLIIVICLQVGIYSVIIVGFTCTIIKSGGFEIRICLSTLECTQTL